MALVLPGTRFKSIVYTVASRRKGCIFQTFHTVECFSKKSTFIKFRNFSFLKCQNGSCLNWSNPNKFYLFRCLWFWVMSRAPYFDSGRLPALKSSYDEPRLSHRELIPVHPVHRIDYLEEKIAAQVSNVFVFFRELKCRFVSLVYS